MKTKVESRELVTGDMVLFDGAGNRKPVWSRVIRIERGQMGRIRLWVGVGQFSEKQPSDLIVTYRG